jgi:hypothetical protein
LPGHSQERARARGRAAAAAAVGVAVGVDPGPDCPPRWEWVGDDPADGNEDATGRGSAVVSAQAEKRYEVSWAGTAESGTVVAVAVVTAVEVVGAVVAAEVGVG